MVRIISGNIRFLVLLLIFTGSSISVSYGQVAKARKLNRISAASFDRDIYPAGPSTLPFYSERLPCSDTQNSKPAVIFTNTQFEPVNTTDPEWKKIDANNLKDAIEVRTTVQIELGFINREMI